MNVRELNQSDRCLYFSCPVRYGSSALDILLYVSAAAVVLLTMFGNLLVIISVFYFKQLHTPTNMLVLCLAVSDFLIGVLVMPPTFIWTIESCWIFSSDYCLSFMITAFFLVNLSIYQIALIAVDRYFALSNPFLYTNTMSVRRVCIVILSNWCLLLPYNILMHYLNGSFTNFIMCSGECFIILNTVLYIIDLLISFIIPCAVIIILYTGVFLIARKHASAIRELSNLKPCQIQAQKGSYSRKSEQKAAKVLGILVSIFMSCLFPYFIYTLLQDLIELQLASLQKVLIVLYLNSTINPVIYALFYPWFRRCVKIILTLQILQTDSALMKVI